MMNTIKLITLIILLIHVLSFSQSIDTTSIDNLIEDLVPEPGIDFQEYDEINEFEMLQDNPININTADINILQKVPGLDLNYAMVIVQYREKYGHYFSKYELYSIKAIPKNIVRNIIPFISTYDISNKSGGLIPDSPALNIKFRTRSSYNFHEANDSLYLKYPGSKLKLFNKFSLKYNSVEFGFITEKDPGEKSYMDLFSSYLVLNNTGPFNQIILGDFRYESGSGLILGKASGYSKTIDAAYSLKKPERLIRPNTSSNEDGYYRGAAASLMLSDIQFSGFYSNQFRDAISDSTANFISNLLSSGYHRTTSEIRNNNTIHEIKWGIRSEYSFGTLFNAAILFYRSYFSKPFISNLLYSPKGNKFSDLSFSYDFHPESAIYMSGEFAYDFNSVASLNSLQITFKKYFLFFSSVRNYPRNFISLSGHSLTAQSGQVQNEIGFYNGFKISTEYGILNFYYDQFRFPFGGYRFPISNSGEELNFGYSNSFPASINIKMNYKYENKDYILNDTSQIYIGRRLRNDFRFTVEWSLSGNIRIRTLLEYNSILIKQTNQNEEGFLLSNSICLRPIKYLDLSCSIGFFRTDSYYSSVYEYDNFINGMITGRVLYGEGLKINVHFKYHLLEYLVLSAQYSETFKPKDTLINPLTSIITNNIIIQLESVFN